MFTIYIHILEVLAGYLEGTFADNIHEMGICFERKLIDKGLRELEKEGFVTFRKLGKVKIWSITEKAIEYCHIVVKKDYDAKYAKEALAMHEERKKQAQEAPKEAISEELETPTEVIIMDGGKVTFPLYGNLTIDEVVTAYEENAPVKITSATLSGDDVTLTFEPIPHDDSYDDCEKCGYRLQTDEERYHLLCTACLWE